MNIPEKIENKIEHFLAHAEEWAHYAQPKYFSDPESLTWVQYDPQRAAQIATTAIGLYLDGLVQFNVIDDFKSLSVWLQQDLKSKAELKSQVTIIFAGQSYNLEV